LGIDVFFCKGEMMNIEKETSEYQRIVATVVGDLSEAELKFYLCGLYKWLRCSVSAAVLIFLN
jgi:hypothetical protein